MGSQETRRTSRSDLMQIQVVTALVHTLPELQMVERCDLELTNQIQGRIRFCALILDFDKK